MFMIYPKSLIASVSLILIAYVLAAAPPTCEWTELEPGLELTQCQIGESHSDNDASITIVRIDPYQWNLKLYAKSAGQSERNLTTKAWGEKHNLVAAINAGMYLEDHSTHCGYMKAGEHLNNPQVITSDYRSAAAFGPKHDSLPPFRIIDLDEASIETVTENYEFVIQNIRLIKHPGENRWPKKDEKWSEAALGEDKDGRALFIFSRQPYTMYDFNEILLSLPIDIVAAQHLEGGPEAQLFVRSGKVEIDVCGSYESGFNPGNGNTSSWPVPNVIGVSRQSN